ncbi:nucleotide exchange factor SIL1 [Pelobates fuscus]|uniref:nucleotide exchange factor SIL1 n=1 Tax=Pelobates fuscus TaxID=191477 RepID=UPI002FE4DCDD
MDLLHPFSNNLKLVGLLLLLILHGSLSDKNVKNSLIIVDTVEVDDNTDAVVEDEDEQDLQDQEVFNPTHEWQVVKPGQAVPAGLHMRLNLQTGKNEAKLLDEKYDTGITRKVSKSSTDSGIYTKEELKEALAKFKEEQKPKNLETVEDLKQRFRPIDILKKEFSEMNINIETDFDIMTRIINRFNHSMSTLAEKLDALYELEYYVHQVDNAQDLHKLGGLQLLINSLNSTEPSLIEHSAFVVGSALASNPNVQIQAFEGGALQKLLVILATEQSVSVKKKALYALSSLLRQFPYAQHQFLKLGGLQVLKNLFREKNGEPLFVRIITLLYDLIMETLLLYEESNIDHIEEKMQQYSQISLMGTMTEQGWCPVIINLINLPENDAREKVLKLVSVLTTVCKDEFRANHNLNSILHSFQKEYEEFVSEEQKSGETDGYFSELLSLVHEVIDKLKP